MATISPKSTPNPTTQSLAKSHQSVRSPLHALRGKIRRYVIFESLTSLLLSLAIAFWVLVALDLGSYLAFTFDWVDWFPTWFRGIVLGLTVGLVCFFVELYKVAKLKRVDIDTGTQSKSFFEKVNDSPGLLFGVVFPVVLLYLAGWVGIGLLRSNDAFSGTVLGWSLVAFFVLFAAGLILRRMMYDFRELSLAKVLERRYPEELGDRVLTAVELRDPRKVEEAGYSQEMVTHVIHEAAERVDRLDPSAVFAWPRLYWRGIWCVLLTLGGFLLSVGVVTAIATQEKGVAKKKPVRWSLNQFGDASYVWFERAVLLEDTRWPQKVQLELQHPIDEPFYVGRADDNVQKKLAGAKLLILPKKTKFQNRYLRARALKWIVRDKSADKNWRSLLWKDLNKELLGSEVPELDLTKDHWKWLEDEKPRKAPTSAQTRKARLAYVSVDELEALTASGRVLDKTPDEKAIHDVLNRLEAHVDMHPFSLKVRQLEVPAEIQVKFQDQDNPKPSTMALADAVKREYVLAIPNLIKDSCPYHYIANDRKTDTGTIETLRNPGLSETRAEKLVPAYHFYDVSGAWPFDKYLAGMKQKRESTDQPRVYQGGTITLFRKMTRKVQDIPTAMVIAESENEKPTLDPPTRKDAQTFQFVLRNVQEKVTIRYAFQDEHGLYGFDEITVEVDKDVPPHRIGRNEQISVKPSRLLRNIGGATYRVTPQAILPFLFDVEDDYGLYSLNYRYRVNQIVDPVDLNRRLNQIAGAVGLGGTTSLGGAFGEITYVDTMAGILQGLQEVQGTFPVPKAGTAIREQRARWQSRDIEKLVNNAKAEMEPLFKELSVKDPTYWTDRTSSLDRYLRDPEYDLRRLNPDDDLESPGDRVQREALTGLDLKVALPYLYAKEIDGKKQLQRSYRLTVWVEAIDNNVDSPNRGVAPSAEWTFMVVPPEDLAGDIRKEELEQFAKLESAYNKLSEEYKRMTRDVRELQNEIPVQDEKGRPIKQPEAPLLLIAEGMQMPTVLDETKKTANEVHTRYYELFLEMRTNRMDSNVIKSTWDNVIMPLSETPDADLLEKNKAVLPLIDESVLEIGRFRRTLLDPTEPDLNVRRENARKQGQIALDETEKVMDALLSIMDRIRGITDRKKITEMLEKIYQNQLAQVERIKEARRQKELEFFNNLGGGGLNPEKPKKPEP